MLFMPQAERIARRVSAAKPVAYRLRFRQRKLLTRQEFLFG
jgi:hypothetical protein